MNRAQWMVLSAVLVLSSTPALGQTPDGERANGVPSAYQYDNARALIELPSAPRRAVTDRELNAGPYRHYSPSYYHTHSRSCWGPSGCDHCSSCCHPSCWTFWDQFKQLHCEVWHGVMDPCCKMDPDCCCYTTCCKKRSLGLGDVFFWRRMRRRSCAANSCTSPGWSHGAYFDRGNVTPHPECRPVPIVPGNGYPSSGVPIPPRVLPGNGEPKTNSPSDKPRPKIDSPSDRPTPFKKNTSARP